ncbi:MAG: hypothetical protein GY884_18675, partial [Proteobacteria bacterium]|nr:hypothetical protein [Pseudomonadota bacterium]
MILVLLACNIEETRDGTVIGNPGDGMTVVAKSASVSYRWASTAVDTVVLESCDGEDAETAVETELDLLEGTSLELEAGDWCALTLELGEPVEIEATIDEIGVLLELESPEIALTGDFTIAEEAYVLELAQPDWLEGLELDVDEEDEDEDTGDRDDDDWELEVDDEHPLHAELVEALAHGSGLYADRDGDGALADTERMGTLAAGEARTADEGAADTGIDDMGSRGCFSNTSGAW